MPYRKRLMIWTDLNHQPLQFAVALYDSDGEKLTEHTWDAADQALQFLDAVRRLADHMDPDLFTEDVLSE